VQRTHFETHFQNWKHPNQSHSSFRFVPIQFPIRDCRAWESFRFVLHSDSDSDSVYKINLTTNPRFELRSELSFVPIRSLISTFSFVLRFVLLRFRFVFTFVRFDSSSFWFHLVRSLTFKWSIELNFLGFWNFSILYWFSIYLFLQNKHMYWFLG
jgi:hypothetical protein